jgi:hypothetical protein
MAHVLFEFGEVTLEAETLETPTAEKILAFLPLEATVQTWGEEVYFGIGVDIAPEGDARDVIEAGEIAYWPPGDAIAIGFGPTPVSHGDEIRLASPGNVWARALNDVRTLKSVRAGARVAVSRID